MGAIVRLQTLEIKKIKDIIAGRIELPGSYNRSVDYQKGEILGIYGGSNIGADRVIWVLWLLQKLICGVSLERLETTMEIPSEFAEICAGFYIVDGNDVTQVRYRVVLKKNPFGKVFIRREKLCASPVINGMAGQPVVFLDFDPYEHDRVYAENRKLDMALAGTKEKEERLLEAAHESDEKNCSHIFGQNTREFISELQNDEFEKYKRVIMQLYQFTKKCLVILDQEYEMDDVEKALSMDSVCLAIPNLTKEKAARLPDSGIERFQKGQRSQLIFTSAERGYFDILDRESIMVTTSDPRNRFIHSY